MDWTPRTAFAEGLARMHPGRAMSEAGSVMAEKMEEAAELVTDVIKLPLTCAGIGIVCLVTPAATVFFAPLVLLLSPLLLFFGFLMTVFGLGRAGLIMTLRGPTVEEAAAGPIRFTRAGRGQSNGTLARQGAPKPPIRNGSLSELSQLGAHRTSDLVRQVTSLVRTNVVKATREVGGEVEQHLHALQRELQSWAGANPNLKPYCHGHIGWLLRIEAKGLETRLLEAKAHRQNDHNGMNGHTGHSPTALNGHGQHGSPHDAMAKNGVGGIFADAERRQLELPWSPRQRPELDLSVLFDDMYESLSATHSSLTPESLNHIPLPEGVAWSDLCFLLVPGLLTKWYPLYMKQLRVDMKRIGLHVTFSRIDTDQPVRINAARLRHEILEMAQTGRKVVLLGHSKGAVDSAAALSLFPELIEFVGGLVSLQGPHGGSAIAHDLSNTNVQKTVVLGALEKLLRGCKHAVLDLSFESRQEFLNQHTYPLHRVPTLCCASCEKRQCSLLTPLIEYVAVRYGEVCDGLVCQGDAILPNCVRVLIDEMDHFGPAWGTFPATDRYDPARLWLSLVSLALRFGGPRGGDSPLPFPPMAHSPTMVRSVGQGGASPPGVSSGDVVR